jgi:hypothetical protein
MPEMQEGDRMGMAHELMREEYQKKDLSEHMLKAIMKTFIKPEKDCPE